jgi:hypothetical protein
MHPVPTSTVIAVEKKMGNVKKYAQTMPMLAAQVRKRAQVTGAKARRSPAVIPPRCQVVTAEKMKNKETMLPMPR